jgi:hypothetical protein
VCSVTLYDRLARSDSISVKDRTLFDIVRAYTGVDLKQILANASTLLPGIERRRSKAKATKKRITEHDPINTLLQSITQTQAMHFEIYMHEASAELVASTETCIASDLQQEKQQDLQQEKQQHQEHGTDDDRQVPASQHSTNQAAHWNTLQLRRDVLCAISMAYAYRAMVAIAKPIMQLHSNEMASDAAAFGYDASRCTIRIVPCAHECFVSTISTAC